MSVKILAESATYAASRGWIILLKNLRRLRSELELDFVVVNGENANVVGITPRQADMIFHAGSGRYHPRKPCMDAYRAETLSR